MKFQKGQSGNPAGKTPGTRNKTTLAIEALLEGEAETITRKAIEKAKSGDAVMIKLCLDRMAPPRRDRPVPFALPPLTTAADASKATAAIVAAVAEGELSPSEAGEISKVVDTFTRAVEATELEARIQALEKAADK